MKKPYTVIALWDDASETLSYITHTQSWSVREAVAQCYAEMKQEAGADDDEEFKRPIVAVFEGHHQDTYDPDNNDK